MATIVLTPEELEAAIKAGTPVQALVSDPAEALAVMTAGKAYVTFKSVQTGTRYTYLIEKGSVTEEYSSIRYFVYYLTGQDNTSDYTYLGWIIPDRFKNGQIRFLATKKTKNPTSQVFKGFEWAWDKLMAGIMPVGLEIWNSGHCARCHRLLTNPDSIAAGFGPECIKHGVGLNAMKEEAVKFLHQPQTVGGHAGAGSLSRESILREVREETTPVAPKKLTPATIVAAVNEDPKIKQMADALWAKHPANPVNAKPVVAAEPLPVDQKVAEALAKSQGWTVDEAVLQLGRRKIVNLNLKREPSKAEAAVADVPTYLPELAQPGEILDKVLALKATNYEKFTMDGIMDDSEATNFWYRRFANDSSPVEV